jgi:hypothetical protein
VLLDELADAKHQVGMGIFDGNVKAFRAERVVSSETELEVLELGRHV